MQHDKNAANPHHTLPRPKGARPVAVPEEKTANAVSDALHEAEQSIGINEWLDPETGEPAEGQSPPHLEQE